MEQQVNVINQDGEIVDTRTMLVSKSTQMIMMGRVVGYEAQVKDGHVYRPVTKDSKDDTWRMWA